MRMARHHQRMAKDSKLSLVSLMDIFTILVFFLMLQGRKLVDVAAIMAREEEQIVELSTELAYQITKSSNVLVDENGEPVDRAITIMGDKSIPYALLKRIMQTCAQAGFTNISLAVESIEQKSQTAAVANANGGQA